MKAGEIGQSVDAAKKVGEAMPAKGLEGRGQAGGCSIAGAYIYTARVKALADAARAAGPRSRREKVS